jgi:hypothetical protein
MAFSDKWRIPTATLQFLGEVFVSVLLVVSAVFGKGEKREEN